MSKDKEGDKEKNVDESEEEEHELRFSPIILSVTIIFLITIIISLVIVLLQRIEDSASNYCLKPGCVIAATKILHTIDPQIDPCDDFYNYACGNYLKTAKEENTTQTEIYKLAKIAKKQYHKIYTDPPKDSDELPHKNLKKIYSFCMDLEERENGVEYMNNILKRLGGWPVLEKKWDPINFYWLNTIVRLRQMGLDHSIFLEVGFKFRKDKINYLQIKPSFEFKEDKVSDQNYTKYMVDIARAFGADPIIAIHEMNETYEFVKKIEEIYYKYWEDYNRNETLITMSQLQIQNPQINWMEFINQIMHPYKIKETDLVHNNFNGFMEDLDDLLNSTTRKTQANYMMWMTIQSIINWLPQELSQSINKYMQKQDVESQFDICRTQIAKIYPYVDEALYSKKYAPKETREKVMDVLLKVKKEYRNVLVDIKWMDEQTKKFALSKLDAMKHLIGGYEGGSEELLRQLYYAYVNINAENYLEFIVKMRKEVINFMFSLINKPTHFANVLKVLYLTLRVNAFYASENFIYVPAAILQDMVFNFDYPDYLHYASLAYLIGHEITHGFTQMSNKDGIEGDLKEWWTNQTAENYYTSTQCLVDLYENYTKNLFGFQLNGTLTLDENIADVIGTHVAYKLFVENFEQDYNAMLPGFEDHTPNQLFWIANSRFYCDPNEVDITNSSDVSHGVPSFRFVTPAAHLGYFAKDFYCRPGTRMNPIEKCDLL